MIRAALRGLVCLVSLASTTGAQTRAESVDSVVVAELRQSRIPGAVIGVVRGGRIVFERAYGAANLEWGSPMTTHAVFELASITKQFTAALVMLLAQEGKLSLDDPISRYIDSTPAAWSPITVRHLLTHTAGLEIASLPIVEGSAPLRISTKVAYDHTARLPLRFPAGREGWYSDAGYFLAGMVIERAGGERYRPALQRRIFDPLGMTGASVLDKARVLRGRVPTYSLRDGEHVNWRRDWDHELPAFFGIFATLADLVKWDLALRDTSLLRAPSLRELWTPARTADGRQAKVLDQPYGLGFELAELRGRRTVGHGGASGTYILRMMDEPLTVIVLTNLDNPSGRNHSRRLARAIAGAIDPTLRPPEQLIPIADPDSARTRKVRELLSAFAANAELPHLTSTATAWWAAAAGRRIVARNQLREAGPPIFLGMDRVAGRTLWDPGPISDIAYYRVAVPTGSITATVAFTADGTIARVEFPFR